MATIKRSVLSLFLLYITMLLASCGEKPHSTIKTDDPGQASQPVKYKKPAASFNDSILIDTRSAVFFNPDKGQLDRIKKIVSPGIFESNTHDCFYQMRNARMVIKKHWPAVRVIETDRARYLIFIKENKTTTCIDLNSKGDICGLFLFDQMKEPELADMMNIYTALEFYFKK
jgi:hypothetical protein